MRDLAGKVALVTGAGSGIGRATAFALARKGVRLILADVNEPALRAAETECATQSACLLAQAVDVSKRDEMEAFARRVHQLTPCVDILVNNAGVYLTGGFLDLTLDDWEWSMSTNLWGMILASHFFVPKMVERGEGGHVVNMASMYGYWIGPSVIGYLTPKFGVFGFSEALREDLRGNGISVSTVCPGIIRTNILQNMRVKNDGDAAEIRENLRKTYQRRNYEPERVASAIVKAIQRNRRLVLVSPEARLMYHLQRLCPALSRVISRAAAKRMFRQAKAP